VPDLCQYSKENIVFSRPTLVFPVAALDLLVDVLLHFTLKDSGSGGLVEASSLQDVCRIDPIIGATSHNMLLQVHAELKLINRNLLAIQLLASIRSIPRCQSGFVKARPISILQD
jgi:hypothetical protein